MKKPAHVVEIFLQPGEFYFGDRNTRIRTLLGSCVAITLWHPGQVVGGMCHFMLPSRPAQKNSILDGRYADEAMHLFLQEIKKLRLPAKDFQGKLFGGGNMFQTPNKCHKRESCQNVACKNVMAGRELLKQHGIDLVAQHAGESGHRNVIFDVWSGEVWLRHVKNTALITMSKNEKCN